MGRIVLIITIIGIVIATIIGLLQLYYQILANANNVILEKLANKIDEKGFDHSVNNYNYITLNINVLNVKSTGLRTNANFLQLLIDTLVIGNQLEKQRQNVIKIKDIIAEVRGNKDLNSQFFSDLEKEIDKVNKNIIDLNTPVSQLMIKWNRYWGNSITMPPSPTFERNGRSIRPGEIVRPEDFPSTQLPLKKENHWYYLITNPRRFWDRDHPDYRLDRIKLNEIKPIVIPNLEMNHPTKDNCTGEQVNGNNTPVGKNNYSN